MSRIIKRILFIFLIEVIVVISIYFGLVSYYSINFAYGTWINNAYCTGKTIEEVQDEINKNNQDYQISIIDKDGHEVNIKGEEIGFRISILDSLNAIKKEQNPFLWPFMIMNNKEYVVDLKGDYDRKLLEKVLSEKGVYTLDQPIKMNHETEITHNENGYELNEKYDQIINENKLEIILDRVILSMQSKVILADEGCYDLVLSSSQSTATNEQWKKISKMQNAKITYNFGDRQEILDNTTIHNWIHLNEDGEVLLDENQVKEYMKELAIKYDTVGKERDFKTHDGRDITVSGGPYGWEIDQKKEVERIVEIIAGGIVTTRAPAYRKEGADRGTNDIGSTYIEIDLGQQKMFYYKDGKQEFESDIVSGNVKRGFSTPASVCFVYNKARNVILRGVGYASFVNYWMKVNGHIGIHDATWRSTFGDQIYKTNGSHGCINTPLNNMKELYGMMNVGTPVVMYY